MALSKAGQFAAVSGISSGISMDTHGKDPGRVDGLPGYADGEQPVSLPVKPGLGFDLD